MRFMSIYKTQETDASPSPEEFDKLNAFVDEMKRSGILIATGGCLPSALGARVRSEGGKMSVVDGPFTETKEVVGGFAIIECESKAHAIEICKRFMSVTGEDCESELRQMAEELPCSS